MTERPEGYAITAKGQVILEQLRQRYEVTPAGQQALADAPPSTSPRKEVDA